MAAAQLRAPLYEDKVVDFLFSKAEITDRSATRAELEADLESEEGHVHGPGCGHDHAHEAKPAKGKKKAASKADIDQMYAAYGAYTEALVKAGVIAGGERLRPTSAATTVKVANGKTNVLNGPYAETKEQLGGFYMIEVPDLDAALSWASRCPGASHGTIEVRPVWPMQ